MFGSELYKNTEQVKVYNADKKHYLHKKERCVHGFGACVHFSRTLPTKLTSYPSETKLCHKPFFSYNAVILYRNAIFLRHYTIQNKCAIAQKSS